MSQKFDVVIVGAGPAGLACALMLQQKGIDAVIIEKSVFPRDKICGDALGVDVVNQLSLISSELGNAFAQLVNKTPSYGVKIVSPGGFHMDFNFYRDGIKRHGYICERLVFDNFLFEQLSKYNKVKIFSSTTVTNLQFHKEGVEVETDKEILSAKIVIGADGAHSIVNKKTVEHVIDKDHYCAGLRQYYENVKGFTEENFIELHFFKELLPGYLWIFPLPDGKANVGVGVLSSVVSKNKVNLKECMQKLLKEHPSLKERFENAKPLETVKGYGLPVGSKKRKLSGERFLLLGDAASLIDPFTGEGIANAIRSGRVGAGVIEKAIMANDFSKHFLLQYDKEIYSKMWLEFKVSRQLQNISKLPWAFDFVVRKIQKSHYLKQFMNDALVNVHKKKIMTGPRFLFHLFFK